MNFRENIFKMKNNKEVASIPNNNLPIKKQNSYNLIIILLPWLPLLLFVSWQLWKSPVIQIVKSVSAGLLLVYYSWELIYFDSVMPGIQPASPLSPPSIRTESGHTLHLNYALAIVVGLFFALFVNWYA